MPASEDYFRGKAVGGVKIAPRLLAGRLLGKAKAVSGGPVDGIFIVSVGEIDQAG
jgi:hypothetical protein